MFNNVLVGVDGRIGGRDAIALARLLAEPESSLTFAHVYGGATASGRVSALAVPLALESSERLLAHAARELGEKAGTVSVCDSSVGRGLRRLAEQRKSDLLVVGSCHRGMLGRAVLGDDTRRALNGAPCAVGIAPSGYSSLTPRLSHIGVGCDRSAESAQALHAAHVLAARHGAAIRALAVVSLQDIPYGEPIPELWPKVAGQLVVDELHRLDDLEGVEGDATYGDPGEELAAFGAGLDLLIVGSRSYGPVGRLFNGSTSNYLERHARCPLLVLPRSARSSHKSSESENAQATAESVPGTRPIVAAPSTNVAVWDRASMNGCQTVSTVALSAFNTRAPCSIAALASTDPS
jgi:nucleotide-binding universal stress UspA family protein